MARKEVEGVPVSNRLGDNTDRYFAKDVGIQAPAEGSPGSEKERRGWLIHADGVGM